MLLWDLPSACFPIRYICLPETRHMPEVWEQDHTPGGGMRMLDLGWDDLWMAQRSFSCIF